MRYFREYTYFSLFVACYQWYVYLCVVPTQNPDVIPMCVRYRCEMKVKEWDGCLRMSSVTSSA